MAIPPAVAAVIVSRDRPVELEKTLLAVRQQKLNYELHIIVVDCSVDPNPIVQIAKAGQAAMIRSSVNLGGAGGFALGIMTAIASGAKWIWLMDDDGRPVGSDVLHRLLQEAEQRELQAVAPAVIDADDATRFAFPYAVKHRYVFRTDQVEKDAFFPATAHLFNGLLIEAAAIFAAGLPDIRMFIRGDEVDFMFRMRRAGLRFGTTTSATFEHPSSGREICPIWGGRLHVVYPQAAWKRRSQYRNRAYNFSRHKQWLLICIDLVRYPYFFLLCRRGDVAGLKEWLVCSWAGIRGRLGVDPSIDLSPVPSTLPLR